MIDEADEAQLVGVSLDNGQMVDGVHLDLRWYARHSSLPRGPLAAGASLETSTLLAVAELLHVRHAEIRALLRGRVPAGRVQRTAAGTPGRRPALVSRAILGRAGPACWLSRWCRTCAPIIGECAPRGGVIIAECAPAETHVIASSRLAYRAATPMPRVRGTYIGSCNSTFLVHEKMQKALLHP